MYRSVLSTTSLAVALALPPCGAAQSAPGDRDLTRAVWFTVQQPTYTGDFLNVDGSYRTMLVDAGVRLRLFGPLAVVAEVPMVNSRGSAAASPLRAGTMIGNPYFGVRLSWSRVAVDVGGRLARVKMADSAYALQWFTGMTGDVERYDAYLPDMNAALARVTLRVGGGNGLVGLVRAGPAVIIPGHDALPDDPDVFADIGVRAGLSRSGIEVLAGLDIRKLMTSGETIFGDEIVRQFVASLSRSSGSIRPTVFLRLPLGATLDEDLRAVVGAGLVVGLR